MGFVQDIQRARERKAALIDTPPPTSVTAAQLDELFRLHFHGLGETLTAKRLRAMPPAAAVQELRRLAADGKISRGKFGPLMQLGILRPGELGTVQAARDSQTDGGLLGDVGDALKGAVKLGLAPIIAVGGSVMAKDAALATGLYSEDEAKALGTAGDVATAAAAAAVVAAVAVPIVAGA
ncbi:MAG TPA: hypothetical protein VEC14_07355, partial [Reyranellaceae bacterium]|nr:hypothetical protein [Reyranellaceae bacterium]